MTVLPLNHACIIINYYPCQWTWLSGKTLSGHTHHTICTYTLKGSFCPFPNCREDIRMFIVDHCSIQESSTISDEADEKLVFGGPTVESESVFESVGE
ncbi:unnamed protein product [Rhizophagus irregularis]|nr:unnamed protein product [Rhizophagus irregularis]